MKNRFGTAAVAAEHLIRYGMSEEALAQLATYNTEVARGIMHTDQWQAQMAELQRRFTEAQSKLLMAELGI